MNTSEQTRTMSRRATATGSLVAAAAAPYTFQRSLITRSNLDQAIVTGLSFAITEGVVSALQQAVESGTFLATRPEPTRSGVTRWSRATIAADLALVAGGVGLQRLLRQQPDERLPRATGRTAGQLLAFTGAAGVLTGTIQETTGLERGWRPRVAWAGAAGLIAAQREWDRRRREAALEGQGLPDSTISATRSLAMGAGVAVGASLLGAAESRAAGSISRTVARFLPGGETAWRPLGHAVTLGLVALGARAGAQRVFRMIEGKQFSVEPAIDVRPLHPEVSGGPGSLVDFHTLAKMGRRFVWTLRDPEAIEAATGEQAKATPIRIYVGLESVPTEEERVQLAMAELERTRAFDRSWLMLTTPTGTGYANYAAAGALELLSLGDCANVVMQYSARPSPISIDRVSEGRKQVRLLVDAIKARLAEQPEAERPKVVMFGESLGAWSSQDAFLDLGTQGLVAAGIDHAVWIGTPMESKWKDQVLGGGRPDVDSSLIGVFNDLGEWEALPAEARERIRYLMITHYNDGVAVFGPSLAVQAPPWLGDPENRPPRVPRSQRWIPITSFVQGLIDNKNAARVVPGVFEAEGHDYRADLVPFFDALLGFGATEERKARIVQALETEELRRTRWITERGKVGESMAAAVVDELRAHNPAAFEEAVQGVQRSFLAAEGDT
jgi:uncharacterized membrane protein